MFSCFKWLLVPFLLISIEAGVQVWRHVGIEASRATVFQWKGAPLVTDALPPFGDALKTYMADRGADQDIKLPDGRSIKVFYFEWDDVEAGPFSALAGHETEVCNVAAGFRVIEAELPRMAKIGSNTSLEFHYTKLAQPDGHLVYVYKMPWIQGIGAWHVDSSRDRMLRFRRSFLRHRGAARVIQAGIFGADSEKEAWTLFQRDVVAQLEWGQKG